MSQFSLRVHHFEKRGGQVLLTKITPYVRVSDHNAVIFLQKGRAFGEGGGEIRPIPDWAIAAVERMNKKTRETIGFTDEHIAKLKAGEQPAPDPEPEPIIPAPREETLEPPNRALTSEEAEAMDFATLKEYANQRGITSNSKVGLIDKLKEEGWVH